MQNMQNQEIVRILAANQQHQQQQYYLAQQLAQQQATPPTLPVNAANQVLLSYLNWDMLGNLMTSSH